MDTGAELTLQIARRAQSRARPDVPQAPDLWLLWPGGERLDWVRARARLGALGKPLLVAPLLEPGMLGIWPIDMLDEERKRAVGRGLANQVQYYAEKLVALGVEDGPIRFASGSSPYEMSRDEFLHWATEYAINVGITLEAAADGASARVRILPARGRPPLTL
jgi:hypothetical protein